MPRSFKVCLELERPYRFLYNDIKSAFINMGYRIVEEESDRLVFEKGSKIATYIGLINWNLVYRKVLVEIYRVRRKRTLVYLTYNFSWLTSIPILIRAARNELIDLSEQLGARDIKVLKYR